MEYTDCSKTFHLKALQYIIYIYTHSSIYITYYIQYTCEEITIVVLNGLSAWKKKKNEKKDKKKEKKNGAVSNCIHA